MTTLRMASHIHSAFSDDCDWPLERIASTCTFIVISIRFTSGCSMIAARGAPGSLRFATVEPWSRSFAYVFA